MRKFKYKFKKIIYKVIPCIVIFSLIFTFCFVSNASEVDYVTNAKFNSLSDIFSGVTSGGWVFDDVNTPPINLTSPYIRSVSRPAQNENFEIVGNFNLQNIFSNDLYYTITVPLTWYWGAQSASFIYLSLIDNNGNAYDFETLSQVRPDTLASSTATSTFIFKLNISGNNLQEVSKFKITVKGRQWHDTVPYVNIGLLQGRFITISSMTEYEYNLLYGGNNEPIAPGGNDTVASYESYEQQLLESGGFSQAVSFYESFDNARIQLPIVAASRLVSELFNYDSDGITIFETIATFSLALGVIVLFLAIAPRLKGASK